MPALIILGKMHFLLISENEFFDVTRCNRMTSFMEFMTDSSRWLFINYNDDAFYAPVTSWQKYNDD